MGFQHILGGRVIKTGVAVFLTAAICQALQLPVVFAVIAAIVTVEPTVAASVKKGLVRFPAAAVGAGFAMFFDFLFGQVPITYALASVCTIMVCHRLHWDDAIIVATLTAVAMIPDTKNEFLSAFFIRLGTTSIGIIISSLVNFIILPPKFGAMIGRSKADLVSKTADLLYDCIQYLLYHRENPRHLHSRLNQLSRDLERSFQYIQFQREEMSYRKHGLSDLRRVAMQQKQLDVIRKMTYHLGNLIALEPAAEQVKHGCAAIEQAVEFLVRVMKDQEEPVEEMENILILLRQLIRESEHGMTNGGSHYAYFPPIVRICYELLAISQLVPGIRPTFPNVLSIEYKTLVKR